jgi:hypothetical protein
MHRKRKRAERKAKGAWATDKGWRIKTGYYGPKKDEGRKKKNIGSQE